jgi:tetratricopeptide (TPR) repeat protein
MSAKPSSLLPLLGLFALVLAAAAPSTSAPPATEAPALPPASASAAAPPAPAAGDFATSWPPLAAELDRSVVEGDGAGLRRALDACRGWREAAPGAQRALVHYAAAYGAYRLSFRPEVQPAERDALLEEAVKDLKESLRLDPHSGDAGALLAGVYGAQIAAAPARGMSLGPQIATTLRQALAAEPDNPRVVLQDGLNAFHTPAAYGGSVEKAEASIRRAITLFEKEPASKPWPNWGRFDAHVWLGQVLLKKGDRVGAKHEFEVALALEPRSQWVRSKLLPQAEGGR